jgi:hypothetical protein
VEGKFAAFYVEITGGGKQLHSIVLTQTDNGEWEVINEGY